MADQSSDEDSELELHISSLGSEEGSECEHDDLESDVNESRGDELSERETGSESESETDKVNSSEQQSSSEWIEFNKKVISMRPLFKSAKVQFIHKASRSIKILRKKKGSPEQVDRNNRKADRLVQEIAYINRLKKDVIAKFSLLHSKEEVTKIVNTGDSTMEYRVKAKIASMPKISKAAEDYHIKHPDWRDSLFKLIQLAGKNMKKKRRKIRGLSNRGSKINEENRQNAKKQQSRTFQAYDEDGVDLERFGVSNFPEPPPEDSTGSVGTSDEENSVDVTESEEEEDDGGEEEQPFHESVDKCASEEVGLILRTSKSKPVRILSKNNGIVNVYDRAVEGESNLGESNIKKTIPTKQKPVSATLKFRKEKTVQRKDLNSKRLHSENSSVGDGGSESESKPKANVDPFFLTSDDKEYKTLWKVEPADSFKNKKPNEPEFMFKNVVSGRNKKGQPNAKVPRLDMKEKKKAAGGKGQQSEVSFENLHPSWQAKKKMSVVAFQGKKVVFDDD